MTLVARTRADLVAMRAEVRRRGSGGPVCVVMTMGALHAGHVELIRRARARGGVVIVTEFLNPLQFAPGEDLSKYPRTFDLDMKLCQEEGVDLVFAPTPETVYPSGEPITRVSAGPVGDRLEGHSRPGHFDGVLTVVAKLLHLTEPDVAYFGRKDAQQLWLIARMVTDLDFDVEIVAVPTVRDADGLALSSRNSYLSSQDRQAALALPKALRCADEVAQHGSAAEVLTEAAGVLSRATGVETDYVALVDPLTFEPVAPDFVGDGLLLVAARVGTTRLIDNSSVHLSGRG